jgi:hypothetical protein
MGGGEMGSLVAGGGWTYGRRRPNARTTIVLDFMAI